MRATIYRMTYVFLIAWLAAQKAPEWKIQDNSFLVEEAYNQDPRVVQHITGIMRDSHHHWTGTFTQEWPMGGIKNQISYTLPLDGSSDALVNYRYQLVGTGETTVACAPRLSLIVGSRDDRHLGLQALIPVSVVIDERFVTHWNAGATTDHGATTWNAGASVIFAARPKVHLMLENVWNSDDRALTVSPGVRWAYDFKSGLQIVPGFAVPIDTRSHERSVFLYLSFEHPF
jgi:hypothetical protein